VRQKALQPFPDLAQTQEEIKAAKEMVALRKEVEKKATTPEALTNTGPLLTAGKKRLEAESILMALIGHPW